MFGSKKSGGRSNNHTLISRGTRVVGDIHFIGELQIEGQVIGNVIADDTNDAHLVIHDSGLVEGEVAVPAAVINGSVRGDVHSSKHLELASKAIIQGNVYYNVIEMIKGAQVNGSLVHQDNKTNDQASDSTSTTKNTTDNTPSKAKNAKLTPEVELAD